LPRHNSVSSKESFWVKEIACVVSYTLHSRGLPLLLTELSLINESQIYILRSDQNLKYALYPSAGSKLLWNFN